MNSKELREVLYDFRKQLLVSPDGLLQRKYYQLSPEELEVYRACSSLILALDAYNVSFVEPVGLIARCVFCGQVIPSQKGGNL